LERALILCEGEIMDERHLPSFEVRAVSPSTNSLVVPVGSTVAEAEKRLIHKTLDFTANNKTKAAEILGISLKTLHNKLNQYDAEAEN
jgi:DNA-binding NtrC family response regulator